MRKYNVEEIMGTTVIWYEEDGVRTSFGTDPANSDYQAYLNKDKTEQSTPSVAGDVNAD
jgi:hypothetical protein